MFLEVVKGVHLLCVRGVLIWAGGAGAGRGQRGAAGTGGGIHRPEDVLRGFEEEIDLTVS